MLDNKRFIGISFYERLVRYCITHFATVSGKMGCSYVSKFIIWFLPISKNQPSQTSTKGRPTRWGEAPTSERVKNVHYHSSFSLMGTPVFSSLRQRTTSLLWASLLLISKDIESLFFLRQQTGNFATSICSEAHLRHFRKYETQYTQSGPFFLGRMVLCNFEDLQPLYSLFSLKDLFGFSVFCLDHIKTRHCLNDREVPRTHKRISPGWTCDGVICFMKTVESSW